MNASEFAPNIFSISSKFIHLRSPTRAIPIKLSRDRFPRSSSILERFCRFTEIGSGIVVESRTCVYVQHTRACIDREPERDIERSRWVASINKRLPRGGNIRPECFICVLPCFQTIWNTVYTTGGGGPPRSAVNWASKPQLLFLLICQVETAPKVADKKFIRTPRARHGGREEGGMEVEFHPSSGNPLSPFCSHPALSLLAFGHLPSLVCLVYLSLSLSRNDSLFQSFSSFLRE